MIGQLLGEGMGMLRDWFSDRREQKNADRDMARQIKKARNERALERARSGDESEAALDQYAKQTAGWKDDWLLIVTTAPLAIIAFEPVVTVVIQDNYVSGSASQAMAEGIRAINLLPDWYLVALLLVFVDTFGFRRMFRVALEAAAERVASGGKV